MIALLGTKAPIAFTGGGMEIRSLEAGTMYVGFEKWPVGNLEGLFEGLPGGECRAEHWGYTVRGAWRVRTHEGVQTLEAGHAYHLPPGHTVLEVLEPIELVEFTPLSDPYVDETVRAFQRNLPRVLPLLAGSKGRQRRRI